MTDSAFIGKWRIVEMGKWDQAFTHLIEKPHIEFYDNGFGTFYFGNICANIDYLINEEGRAEFTFVGDNDGQEVFGRGWAKINGGEMIGHLFFHEGEASGFKAENQQKKIENLVKSELNSFA